MGFDFAFSSTACSTTSAYDLIPMRCLAHGFFHPSRTRCRPKRQLAPSVFILEGVSVLLRTPIPQWRLLCAIRSCSIVTEHLPYITTFALPGPFCTMSLLLCFQAG